MTQTQLSEQQLAQLSAFAGMLETFKTASSTPTFTRGHGPGGVFSTPGLNQNVFNAMVIPYSGLAKVLRKFKSVDIWPLHEITTGVTAVTGTHPTGNCEPCKVPGNLKTGTITAAFGRRCLSTKTIDVSNLGARNNRGEMSDLRWVGDPFAPDNAGSALPTFPGGNGSPLLSELAKARIEFLAGYAQEYSRELYTGNPANNSGTYAEFRGLNILVNSGYQDAITGAFLSAADSLVNNINLNIAGNGVTYVDRLTAAYRRLNHSAKQQGLAPVVFAFVMPEMMFYELTAVWPCAYATSRCVTNAGGATVNLEATDQRQMVQDMRDGEYLLIDGAKVRVILDDAIPQTDSSGTFTSTIYLLPLTVRGGIAATYMEYFDYENGDTREVINAFGTPGKYETTDAGRFIWARRENGFCVSMDSVARERLILETPWLAARFTNVIYTPIMSTKSGYPSDGNRFYNGGNTSVPAPSFYAPTVYSN